MVNLLHQLTVNDVRVQAAQLLLDWGANVDTADKKDRRPLHWAAYMGHIDVIQSLLAFGADVDCRDKQVKIVFSYVTNIIERSLS